MSPCRLRRLRSTAAPWTRPSDAHISGNPPPQKFVTVTGPVTIKHDDFQFVDDFQGMEVIAKAGTIIAHDGDEPVRTPYDDCVLIMPSRRMSAGQTAVRLGRFTHRVA
jgi:hypothetical protein